MSLVINKPKTWKDLSYGLKSSFLQKAMEENGIDAYVQLEYWTPQRHKVNDPWSLIEAEFWLPNFNVDYHRFYIRAGVVKSNEKKYVEDLLNNAIIPKLIDWMKANLAIKHGSTKRPNAFRVYYKDGEIISPLAQD